MTDPMPCGDKFLDTNFNPAAVYDGAAIILDRIIKIYEMLGDRAPALPDRVIIATGEQPADCEQLVVAFGEMERGMLGEGDFPDACHQPLIVEYKVQVVRCAPTSDNRGNPAPVERVAMLSRTAAIDANILMESICALSLWPGVRAEGTLEVGEPQGGMQSVTLTLRTLLGI
jgi:hypothetical protein